MMKEPKTTEAVLKKVRSAINIPLTLKMRSGWDASGNDAMALAKISQECGVDAITLHPRTATQGFAGKADWSLIEKIKKKVSIPVIGNGDIIEPEDAIRMIDQTGCDAVMVGRTAIGNPWIFQRRDTCTVSLDERFSVIREHLEAMVRFYGERRGVLAFRKHVIRYIRGTPGASSLRVEVLKCITADEVLARLEGFLHSKHNVL